MSIPESLLVALIVMSIVFSCLIALSFFLRAQSFIFTYIYKNKKSKPSMEKIPIEEIAIEKDEVLMESDLALNSIEVSTGELILSGVNEKTTALIMAIVSDELKIPLNELQFKSIKLIT